MLFRGVNRLFVGVNRLFPYLSERVGEVYRVFAHQVGYLDRGKDREDRGRTREGESRGQGRTGKDKDGKG